MTNRSRIAAFLSVSALCLGLTAAPAVFAANASTATKTTKAHTHKKAKSGSMAKKSATPAATPSTPAK
jgi:patatin-like phospholipase/acyl hydrolase